MSEPDSTKTGRAWALGASDVIERGLGHPDSLNARQRALFVAVLHEAGFDWGQSIVLDDPTIGRLLGGMQGLRVAMRPL